jgi:hypothetical protein
MQVIDPATERELSKLTVTKRAAAHYFSGSATYSRIALFAQSKLNSVFLTPVLASILSSRSENLDSV